MTLEEEYPYATMRRCSCPDCGSSGNFEVVRSQKQEWTDSEHSFLIKKLQCKNCSCLFDEIERKEITCEIQRHGHLGRLIGIEMTVDDQAIFEAKLNDLEKLLSEIFVFSSGDNELLTILNNELQEAIMITGSFCKSTKSKFNSK
jgi:hypothetical protein